MNLNMGMAVYALQILPGETQIVVSVGGASGGLYVHNIADGSLAATLTGWYGRVVDFGVTSDGTKLISCSQTFFPNIAVWDLTNSFALLYQKTGGSMGVTTLKVCLF
jgi:hypothetical protein